MVTVAVLDATGVYQGLTTISAAQQTDAHVILPADCDLRPGHYRWDPERSTFVPLQLSQVSVGAAGVSLEAVVAELAQQAIAAGSSSPLLVGYVAAFKKSVDAIGSKS